MLEVVKDDLVDIIKLTPSHLSLLADQNLQGLRVRQLILGGEDLKRDLAQKILLGFPAGTVIHNEYGPTEATVGCIVHSHRAGQTIAGNSVPIGRPIPGMRAYLLNDERQLVPAGVPAELFLAGDSLAQGYFGQPGATADKFLPDPFRKGDRMYASGDIARLLPTGEMEYLGRRDHQVKIRGARVELGAVEAALVGHPNVTEAVVTTFRPRQSREHLLYCRRCGLASNFPGANFDEEQVCDQCRSFDTYRDKAQAYFRSLQDLETLLRSGKAGEYDCLALLSGGKDSTYMLARLADLGLRILAFTLDNGYISEEAKANIRRVTEALGVDHVFGTTPSMNQIFVDSLHRYANVCQGCFKTIYTLSLNLAKARQIPFLVTGLSRGQLFETRLTADLFQDPCRNLHDIDGTVLAARKAYHRVDDAVAQTMDVAALQEDEIFEQVQIVDFYRYCDVELSEMLRYLDRRLPWVRPSDTGRSTNCLINDVGIYIHQRQRGFHNYALPYSWDVRMGHKERDAALEELDDQIDPQFVHRILNEIGYTSDWGELEDDVRLVAYYVASDEVEEAALASLVAENLPEYMVPARFVRIDSVPLSPNGKVAVEALPPPVPTRTARRTEYVPPANDLEAALVTIWKDVLGVPQVGTQDNFFDLGGDSILAIQIVSRAAKEGMVITPAQLFDTLTVADLASTYQASAEATDTENQGPPLLTPVLHWLIEQDVTPQDYVNQTIEVACPQIWLAHPEFVRDALWALTQAHPVLRTRLDVPARSLVELPPPSLDALPWCVLDRCTVAPVEIAAAEQRLQHSLRLGGPHVLGGLLTHDSGRDVRLRLAANHIAVDSVSWQWIIEDVEAHMEALLAGRDPVIPRRRSYAGWSQVLQATADDLRFRSEWEFWRTAASVPPPHVALNGRGGRLADGDPDTLFRADTYPESKGGDPLHACQGGRAASHGPRHGAGRRNAATAATGAGRTSWP